MGSLYTLTADNTESYYSIRVTQDAREFAENGLARALEHTSEKRAPNLEAMARTYPKEVYVDGFDPTNKPELKIVGLVSNRNWNSDRLCVDGNNQIDNNDGCAFGMALAAKMLRWLFHATFSALKTGICSRLVESISFT